MVGDIFDIKTGFHGSVVSNLAKLNFSALTETVNEKHLQPWTAMCSEACHVGRVYCCNTHNLKALGFALL